MPANKMPVYPKENDDRMWVFVPVPIDVRDSEVFSEIFFLIRNDKVVTPEMLEEGDECYGEEGVGGKMPVQEDDVFMHVEWWSQNSDLNYIARAFKIVGIRSLFPWEVVKRWRGWRFVANLKIVVPPDGWEGKARVLGAPFPEK